MKRKTGLLLIVLCVFTVLVGGVYADDPSPEQLVAEHLKSIGVASGSSQIKSVSFSGTVDVEFLQGMGGKMNGVATFVSEGNKMALNLALPDINYPGEYFAYDGRSVTVRNMQPGVRNPIADFIFTYNKVMKNGMLGGVFSNTWPLLDIKKSRPSVMRVRKTKVEGKELYELEYNPRDRHGDMRIRLYFDPETYRHVRSEFMVRTDNDVSVGNNLGMDDIPWERGGGSIAAQVRGEGYYTLTEKFDDFRQIGSLTMPYSYVLDYMVDGPALSGFIGRWKINLLELGFNTPNINQNLFKVGK